MKTPRKLLPHFMLLLFSFSAIGQTVNVTVAIPPPYSIHAIDYLEYRTQTVVTLTNLTNTPQQVKLIASISSPFGQSARIKPSFVPTAPVNLAPLETKVLTGNQLKALNANLGPNDVENTGFDAVQVIRSGTLPEGNYQFCIRVYDYQSAAPLSPELGGCALLQLTHYDPPIIIQPQNNSTVDVTQPQFLNFTWTPAGLAGKTRYELRIVDMTATGLFNPNDAFTGIVLPFFQKANLQATSYPYGINDLPLLDGHKYAIEVVAYDPSNSIAFKNGGRSAVTTFTCKKKINPIQLPGDIVIVNPNPNNNPPQINPNLNIQNQQQQNQYALQLCQENVNIPNAVAISGQGVVKVDDVLNIGGHNLLLTEVLWNGKKLSGKGKITNSWFKIPILVEFSDLEVNSNKVVIAGVAKARDDNNSPIKWINDLANIQFGEQEIQNAIQKLLGDSDKRIVDWPNTKNIGVGMPVGIRRSIGGMQQIIAIVGMQFSPTGSGLNAVAQINIPASGQKLSFGASGVCFGPQGLKNDAFLFLAEDYTVAPNKPVRMHLAKGDPNDQQKGTYVIFETAGFKKLQLDGALRLDDNMAKPIDPQKTVVEAPFKIQVENFNNFMLDNISLTPFELVKLPGFEFTVTGVSYDQSDAANPQGIVFPSQNYNTEGNLWRGFYFKTLKVKLPAKLQANTEINATNMLFDSKGFSGTLSAPVVFGTHQGKMGEKQWPFSLENLLIRFEANDMKEGKFNGKIRVPITKDDFFFTYNASMSYAQDKLNYLFNLAPVSDVDFPAVIAKGKLNNNTSIFVQDTGNGFEPSFHLYGSITLDTKLGAGVNGYGVWFEGITVENLMVDKTGVKLGPNGSIKYNSPQKTLAGFDVSIKEHEIGLNYLQLVLGIDFTSKENNVVGGTAGFQVQCKWENNMLKFDGLHLTEVQVKGDMSIVKVDGYIKFTQNDPVYGTGFQGSLDAEIMLGEGGAGLGIGLELIVGQKQNPNFKYFFFKGEVELPVGIPMTATMRIYGFQGGVYHHMRNENGKYIPDASIAFGIKAGLAIGMDSRRAFHAKVSMEGAFTKNGIDSVGLIGHGYIFTDYQKGFEKYSGNQAIYLGLSVGYSFKKKVFNLVAAAEIQYPANAPVIEGGGEMQIFVDGATKKWFIKVGTPTKPLGVTVLKVFGTRQYFMAGHDLGPMPDLPALVKEVCKVQNMPNARDEASLTSEGQGLAFALGAQFGTTGEAGTGDLEWWVFFARFNFVTAFDVMLYEQDVCQGINGWYANGQGYFAFDGAVGIKFQFRKNSPVRRITIMEGQLGAYAKVGLANPFWIEGNVSGNASFLGVIEGSFTYQVHYGEKCIGKPDLSIGALDGITFIKEHKPGINEKKVSVFAQPQVKLAFSANANKVYEFNERDSEGKNTTRYFRFPLKRIFLREDKPGGKMIADSGQPALPTGQFKNNTAGDIYTFDSKVALPGNTPMLWQIEIDILERINGQWVVSPGEQTVVETIKFTTGPAPKTIEDWNVAHCYPDRFQRYYLQADNVRRGFVQVNIDAYQDLFNLTPQHQFAAPDKIHIRLIPVGGGSALTGEYLGYNNNRVHFRHPQLQNNRIYILQIVKELSPAGFLQANLPNNQANNLNFASNADIITQLTAKEKVLGDLKMQAREYEVYKYVFRTSSFNTLDAKLKTVQQGKVSENNDAPPAARIVSIKMQEGFDKADFKFLTFDWSLGFGFGGQGSGGGDSQGNTQGGQGVSNFKPNNYWDDYLKPWLYDGYNTVLKPAAYPNIASIQPTLPHSLSNWEPLLSQAEINAALNQQVNVNPNNVIMAVPMLKEMKFFFLSEMMAFQDYQQRLMPRLFNIQNPIIKNCMNNVPNCNPALKQLMNYHLANKSFRKITGGAYQTLAGYNEYFIKGMSGDNRKAFDWSKQFGFQIQN